MLVEIFSAILIGIFIGVITGLIPGVHINLVAVIVLSLSPFLLQYTNVVVISIFIISVAITHTFLDFLPSIYLGAPEPATALSILPGHKMLLEGRAYEAIFLTVLGSLFALITAILLVPILIPTVKIAYPFIKKNMAFILIIASVYLILIEKKSRLWAFIIFLMAGVFGFGVLNLHILNEPLLPMLSGLFGISMLVLSFLDKVKIPAQENKIDDISNFTILKSLSGCTIAGILCSFLPGLGPAQGAVLGLQLFKNIGDKGFLILVSGINTLNMVLSIAALYIIDKARSGAIVAISKIMESFNLNYLILFLGSSLIVAGIATFLALYLAKVFGKLINKLNYSVLCLAVIIFIIVLVFIFSKFIGLLVLVIATFIGLIPNIKGIKRSHLMGCLLLPVIFFYLF